MLALEVQKVSAFRTRLKQLIVEDMLLHLGPVAAGEIDEIQVRRGTSNTKAPLLTGSAFLPAKVRKEVAVDPKLLDRCAGRFQLAPNFVLTITREGEHLFAQATGQPKFELFAEAEKEYFLKVVDAQITFEVDAGGAVNQLVLHQAGQKTSRRNGSIRRLASLGGWPSNTGRVSPGVASDADHRAR